MRNSAVTITTVALVVLFAVRSGTRAQGPPAPGRPALEGPPPVPHQGTAAQNNPSLIGTVQQYLLTPVGDIEGLELTDGTDVRFPPHLGAALEELIKPGDRISVVGFAAPPTAYGRSVRALTITNVVTGQTVVDQPPIVRPPPPWLRAANAHPMTLAGTLAHYVLNDRGDVDGLILNNGAEVKFAPNIGAAVLVAAAQNPSAKVQASGYGSINAFGTVVDAMTGSLTVAGQTIPLTPAGPPPPP